MKGASNMGTKASVVPDAPQTKTARAALTARQIKKIREAIPLSLREWAKALGVNFMSAWRWERKGAVPQPSRIRAIKQLAAKHKINV
jgi:DNA-binding transcriptional regulator YiaG